MVEVCCCVYVRVCWKEGKRDKNANSSVKTFMSQAFKALQSQGIPELAQLPTVTYSVKRLLLASLLGCNISLLLTECFFLCLPLCISFSSSVFV